MNRLGLILVASLLALIALGVGIWFFFFNTPPAPQIVPQTPEEIPAPTEGSLHETGEYYDISGTYPTKLSLTTGNEAALATLKQFVETESARFISENRLDSLTPDDIEKQHLTKERRYELDITYKTHTSARTVSYVFALYADTLGAHSNASYKTFTFDTETGVELPLASLFTPGTKYLETLSAIARKELPAIIEDYTGNPASMSEIEFGTTPTKESFQNFYLEGGNLVIIFAPYQVGPWVIGTQTLPIPRSEIAGIKTEYK